MYHIILFLWAILSRPIQANRDKQREDVWLLRSRSVELGGGGAAKEHLMSYPKIDSSEYWKLQTPPKPLCPTPITYNIVKSSSQKIMELKWNEDGRIRGGHEMGLGRLEDGWKWDVRREIDRKGWQIVEQCSSQGHTSVPVSWLQALKSPLHQHFLPKPFPRSRNILQSLM